MKDYRKELWIQAFIIRAEKAQFMGARECADFASDAAERFDKEFGAENELAELKVKYAALVEAAGELNGCSTDVTALLRGYTDWTGVDLGSFIGALPAGGSIRVHAEMPTAKWAHWAFSLAQLRVDGRKGSEVVIVLDRGAYTHDFAVKGIGALIDRFCDYDLAARSVELQGGGTIRVVSDLSHVIGMSCDVIVCRLEGIAEAIRHVTPIAGSCDGMVAVATESGVVG